MGLDKPWVEQYFFWLANLLRGDMGQSYVNHLPVRTVIGQKLPASLELAVASMALAVLVAVPGGIISAVKRGSRIESFLTAFITLGVAIPSFWLGIIMVLVFAVAGDPSVRSAQCAGPADRDGQRLSVAGDPE